MSQHFSSSNNISKELRRWIEETKAEAKEGFKTAMREWANEVREMNVPVGPPHKKKELEPNPYHPGLLKESTRLEFVESADEISGKITIGDYALVDYARYAAARKGVDFWQGQSEAVQNIDAALRRGRDEQHG